MKTLFNLLKLEFANKHNKNTKKKKENQNNKEDKNGRIDAWICNALGLLKITISLLV